MAPARACGPPCGSRQQAAESAPCWTRWKPAMPCTAISAWPGGAPNHQGSSPWHARRPEAGGRHGTAAHQASVKASCTAVFTPPPTIGPPPAT